MAYSYVLPKTGSIADVCKYCRSPLHLQICPACESVNAKEAEQCRICGQKLAATPVAFNHRLQRSYPDYVAFHPVRNRERLKERPVVQQSRIATAAESADRKAQSPLSSEPSPVKAPAQRMAAPMKKNKALFLSAIAVAGFSGYYFISTSSLTLPGKQVVVTNIDRNTPPGELPPSVRHATVENTSGMSAPVQASREDVAIAPPAAPSDSGREAPVAILTAGPEQGAAENQAADITATAGNVMGSREDVAIAPPGPPSDSGREAPVAILIAGPEQGAVENQAADITATAGNAMFSRINDSGEEQAMREPKAHAMAPDAQCSPALWALGLCPTEGN